MIIQTVQNCINVAISNPEVSNLLQTRENHENFWLSSIQAKIKHKSKTDAQFQMVVRVEFDFAQRFENYSVDEDILVEVVYTKNIHTGSDEYRIARIA
jgi:hypothetical protein